MDYWDYIGWKDTFASPWHTRRQQLYARNMGNRSVYTPQLVVNGSTDAVGSRSRKIEAALRNTPKARVAGVDISHGDDGLTVTVDGAPVDQPATVWLVQFDDKETVVIGRGENSGRDITYHNIAKQWTDLGQWSGGTGTYTLPKSAIDGTAEGCAVLVQTGGNGQILGAAKMELMPAS